MVSGLASVDEAVRSPSCSALSLAADEALPGTAPYAPTWLVIECAASWGPNAIEALPDGVADMLTETTAGTGVRILLARRGRVDNPRARGGHVWVAHTDPRRPLLVGAQGVDYRDLLDWDFAALGRGNLPNLDPIDEPMTLVCTNGGRDACCARRSRPLVRALSPSLDIWECSHLGGHRFAPTMLTLPSGYLHGRLTDLTAAEQIAQSRAGRVSLDGLRGRSWLPAPGQVAEIAVRTFAEVRGCDDLEVVDIGERPVSTEPPVGTEVTLSVRHRDGRRWSVDVVRALDPTTRPVSCGAAPEPIQTWRAAEPVLG